MSGIAGGIADRRKAMANPHNSIGSFVLRRQQLGILISAVFLLGSGQPVLAQEDGSALSARFEALWNKVTGQHLPADISMSNGRIEAQQMLISAKFAGRLTEVLVDEGQVVDAGEPIARLVRPISMPGLQGPRRRFAAARRAKSRLWRRLPNARVG